MSVVVVVLGLLAAAIVAARLLRDAAWTRRQPVTAIVIWQLVQGAGLLGMLWVPLVVVAPEVRSDATLREFVVGCLHGFLAAASDPGQRIILAMALAWLLIATGRVLVVLAMSVVGARRDRGAARLAVGLIGTDVESGVRVVPGDAVAAYCLPGRHPLIVISTATKEYLSDAELTAVLAHERAHLRWRHDLVLLGSLTLARAFPFAPIFGVADRECQVLVEMAADDQAVRVAGRRAVSTALLRAAISSAPPSALSMARSAVHARLERLDADQQDPRPRGRLGWGSVLVIPVLAGAAVVAQGLTDWMSALRLCGLI